MPIKKEGETTGGDVRHEENRTTIKWGSNVPIGNVTPKAYMVRYVA